MSATTTSYKILVGGAFVDAASGETMDVIAPATGEVIATVPRCSAEDVDRAVAAAEVVALLAPVDAVAHRDRAVATGTRQRDTERPERLRAGRREAVVEVPAHRGEAVAPGGLGVVAAVAGLRTSIVSPEAASTQSPPTKT